MSSAPAGWKGGRFGAEGIVSGGSTVHARLRPALISEGDTVEPRADEHDAPEIEPQPATVHEIRPVESLKVCPSCLVSNSATDAFCTACGAPLDATTEIFAPDVVAGDAATEIRDHWPAEPEDTIVQPAPAVTAPAASAIGGRPSRPWPLIAALVVAVAGTAVFAVLWQTQASHAHKLSRMLGTTRISLSSTKATLRVTQAKLLTASALSEKRRGALLQAKDVLAKVDPLLSSVDTLQNKAATVGDQGSTLSSDSETFIGTVADLVNYMIHTSAAYYDWGYINQQIDVANSELGTVRYDESLLSGDSYAYGTASGKFATKASAFTQSVRTLQKQLNKVAGG